MSLRPSVGRVVPGRPSEGWRSYLRRASAAIFRALRDVFSQNNLLTYASAIAFQVLIATVALVLFGLALVDLLSLEELWGDNVRPFLESRFVRETYIAVNTTVEKIFATGSATLLVVAALLAIWEVSGAIRAVSGALNEIYETREDRSLLRRYATSIALSIAVILCLVGAVLTANLIPRRDSLPNIPGQAIGWLLAVVLMGCAVWLVLRYAPSVTRSAGWTSVGSIFIVVAWVIASLLFAFYVESIAGYRTATGNLIALLTLTAYFYVSSIVFLTGAQIDELLRIQAKRGRKGLAALTTLDRRHVPRRERAAAHDGRRTTRVRAG